MNTGILSQKLRNFTHLGGVIAFYLRSYQGIHLFRQRHCIQSSGWTAHQCVTGHIYTGHWRQSMRTRSSQCHNNPVLVPPCKPPDPVKDLYDGQTYDLNITHWGGK